MGKKSRLPGIGGGDREENSRRFSCLYGIQTVPDFRYVYNVMCAGAQY